jgi:hypothetical protein
MSRNAGYTRREKVGWNERDRFIAAELYRFVREFQNIEIRVKLENTEETVSVFVHPPYMLQSVTLVDNDEEFKKLAERHRVRLQKVKEARGTTDGAVRELLNRQFSMGVTVEKNV